MAESGKILNIFGEEVVVKSVFVAFVSTKLS